MAPRKLASRALIGGMMVAIAWFSAGPNALRPMPMPPTLLRGGPGVVQVRAQGAQTASQELPAEPLPELPIGIDTFSTLRAGGFAYVDKTGWLPKLVGYARQHFLTRPRRFGKSLLADTINCVFMENGDAKNKLFEGLEITKTTGGEKLLELELPVIRLELNGATATGGKAILISTINRLLVKEALRNGVKDPVAVEGSVKATLSEVVETVRKRHGDKRIVFLVDEYDAPVVTVLEANGGEMDQRIKENLEVLRDLFTECKRIASENFYYSFYTGVSRVAGASLFSGVNQLEDVSFDPVCADLLGFTTAELQRFCPRHMQLLADRLSLDELESEYGGYRFSSAGDPVLNPWCLLGILEDVKKGVALQNRWTSLTPTWASKLLPTDELESVVGCLLNWIGTPLLRNVDVTGFMQLKLYDRVCLLYQAGYLTIGASRASKYEEEVRLRVPNNGTRRSFWVPAMMGNASLPQDAAIEEAAHVVTTVLTFVSETGQEVVQAVDAAQQVVETTQQTRDRVNALLEKFVGVVPAVPVLVNVLQQVQDFLTQMMP